ncbi:MAG: tryptophan-rich sensory protein [Candidatus Bathyarchaeota archaeon]|nr:tryptophan-rich sensory protein [Candidatus Bathyarchaeota archaeon]
MDLNKPVFFQAINTVAFIVTIIVNSLAGSTTLIGGVTSADISDMYLTKVTPAGFTFAIWGIIYVLLAVFVIYQFLPNKNKSFIRTIGWMFALSSALNIFWLFLWHYNLVTYSLLLMFGLLATLIGIYRKLDIGKAEVSLTERLCVHLPFSVYLGWISIATIANVSVALTAVSWDGFGLQEQTWAVLIIAVALVLTLTMLLLRKDFAFSLVVIWALVGIMSKQSEYEEIVLASQFAIAVIIFAIVAVLLLSKLKR